MFAGPLDTAEPSTRLVEPVVDRDAPLSLQWLSGEHGRQTLLMMGVPADLIGPASQDQERLRIASFLSRDDQYNWMIEAAGSVVGSIWVDLGSSAVLGAPSVSYLIGAPEARRRGTARQSLVAVLQFLSRQGTSEVFARALVGNRVSAHLLSSVGFARLNEPYVDSDRLHWQNFVTCPSRLFMQASTTDHRNSGRKSTYSHEVCVSSHEVSATRMKCRPGPEHPVSWAEPSRPVPPVALPPRPAGRPAPGRQLRAGSGRWPRTWRSGTLRCQLGRRQVPPAG
jgi:RimJ/RimL family protein N-acetyltransferase